MIIIIIIIHVELISNRQKYKHSPIYICWFIKENNCVLTALYFT